MRASRTRGTVSEDSANWAPDAVPVQRFRGHSGADVWLCSDGRDGPLFVRKIATTAEQGLRLRRQCAKQAIAGKTCIPAPRVLGEGLLDTMYYFDSEYVPGIAMSEVFSSGRDVDTSRFVDFLMAILRHYDSSKNSTLGSALFLKKIGDVQERCLKNSILRPHLGRLRHLFSVVHSCPWNGIPASASHGDLTLGNIIEDTSGRYILIDFDESGMPTYFQDIGKLFQDLDGEWFLRDNATSATGAGGVARLSTQIALSGLRTAFVSRLSSELSESVPFIRQFAVLHLLRTLPYCRDGEVAEYVLQRTEVISARIGEGIS